MIFSFSFFFSSPTMLAGSDSNDSVGDVVIDDMISLDAI